MSRSDLTTAAVDAARRARGRLVDAMELLQATEPTPVAAEPVARRVSQAIRHLFTAEGRDDDGILASMGEAIEILREVLGRAQESSEHEAVQATANALAAALTVLFPAREELARALATAVSPGEEDDEPVLLLSRRREGPGERRGRDRAPVEAAVGFHTESNFFTGYSGDISDGGLFIATWAPLPVGHEVALSFILPTGRQIDAVATVSWIRQPPLDSTVTFQPGMGVVFSELSEADRQAVAEFIRQRTPLFHE